jgi:hypothetical protein
VVTGNTGKRRRYYAQGKVRPMVRRGIHCGEGVMTVVAFDLQTTELQPASGLRRH